MVFAYVYILPLYIRMDFYCQGMFSKSIYILYLTLVNNEFSAYLGFVQQFSLGLKNNIPCSSLLHRIYGVVYVYVLYYFDFMCGIVFMERKDQKAKII